MRHTVLAQDISPRFAAALKTQRLKRSRFNRVFTSEGQSQKYYRLQESNPNRSRKQWDFPSSGIHIRIREPWFDGDSGEPWQARHQVADALKAHLAYRRSVALPDISTAVDNVFMETPKRYLLSTNSVLVYDKIYGGRGLTEAL